MNKAAATSHNRMHAVQWLRSSVLGANDGLVSTASLVLGVSASHASREAILIAGIAGLISGAMSMATGQYVSAQSQTDTEEAELDAEREQLADDYPAEKRELAEIYIRRGLDPALARQVAEQLMARDALAAHARDELGITQIHRARPFQSAWTSGISFAVGAALPLLGAVLSPQKFILPGTALVSLVGLALMGATAAHIGRASRWIGAARVTGWGALAMLITTLAGLAAGSLFA